MNINSEETKTCTNQLIKEKSPYLLQHAHNPVNWYPWSYEAFQKAHIENKPIFLSIGYSTCHWCHVMERESFEDDEVAKALNTDFISIKVDREERPDIDQIYMSFCQATTGHGGWPLTVFLTPDKKPFYVGTYYSKHAKYGNPGLMELLNLITIKWQNNQDQIKASAEEMTLILNDSTSTNEYENIEHDIFKRAFGYFYKSFDAQFGGFGIAPKFPAPHNLLFLLRYFKAFDEQNALKMVEKTLLQMYKGGIFDHLGYGFSRYSTDDKWLVPHFEKMLYDNALLMMAYTEAFQATRNDIYKNIAEKIGTYVLRDLRSKEGGFYSAEDADSEGIEGKFYVWSTKEIEDVLGEERAKMFCQYFNITEKGNFEGANILNFIKTSIDEIEGNHELKYKLDEMVSELFSQREKRIHPHKDDKVLTSWNGLMIAALAMAGRAFNNPDYISYAREAVLFIENNLIREDGRLFARYRDGDVKYLAYQEDYAFMIWAYVELYEASFNTEYLEKAVTLTKDMFRLFTDDRSYGFYMYGNDSEQLIVRPKEIYDGALPSGNSVAVYLLLKLSKLTGDLNYEEKAEEIINSFASNINNAPIAYTMMLTAILFSKQPIKEIVLAGKREDNTIKDMIDSYNNKYLPFSVVILNKGDGDLDEVNKFASCQVNVDGKSTAYVCEGVTCHKPVFDVEDFNKLLE